MPLSHKLQALKTHYKDYLRKLAAHQRDGDAATGGVVGLATQPTVAIQRAHYIIADELAQQRIRVEASFDHAFAKVRSLATSAIDVAELKAAYRDSKQRAKERLRQAIDAKLEYLTGASARASASTPELSASATPSVGTQVAAPQGAATGLQRQHATQSVTTTSSLPELEQLFGSDGLLRRSVLYLVGSASRAYMTSLNTTTVHGGLDTLAAALRSRQPGQALVTVCNHVAALDDPLLVAALLPEGALEQPDTLRWTLCATDRCFRYAAFVPFFRAAKVLPIARGGGLAQPGMAAAEARLAAGDWVHLFPEGTRSRDGVTLGPVRKGVGRLVASVPEDRPPPLLLPFVHRGMEGVMPRGKMLPATGQKIDVMVGDPIPVDDLLAAARAHHWPADRLHTAVAARVSRHLHHLAARLDAKRAGQPDPGPLGPEDGPYGGRASAYGDVSSLDHFDVSDLAVAAELKAARRRRQGAVAAAWERVKFRMQHRAGVWVGGLGVGAQGVEQQGVQAHVQVQVREEVHACAGPAGSAAGGMGEGSWGALTGAPTRQVRWLVERMYGGTGVAGSFGASGEGWGVGTGAADAASLVGLGPASVMLVGESTAGQQPRGGVEAGRFQ